MKKLIVTGVGIIPEDRSRKTACGERSRTEGGGRGTWVCE